MWIRNKTGREKETARYHNAKKIVYDYYGWQCKCCGETMPQFLTIDHVNNDGNIEATKNGHRRGGYWLFQKIIESNFPDSFQILCYNCNCGKHRNGGTCPHKKV